MSADTSADQWLYCAECPWSGWSSDGRCGNDDCGAKIPGGGAL